MEKSIQQTAGDLGEKTKLNSQPSTRSSLMNLKAAVAMLAARQRCRWDLPSKGHPKKVMIHSASMMISGSQSRSQGA